MSAPFGNHRSTLPFTPFSLMSSRICSVRDMSILSFTSTIWRLPFPRSVAWSGIRCLPVSGAVNFWVFLFPPVIFRTISSAVWPERILGAGLEPHG